MRPRVLALSVWVGGLIILFQAGVASAECYPLNPAVGHQVPTKYVFTATVESVDVTWEGDARGYRVHGWAAPLLTDRIYRGEVPAQIKLHGYGAGCSGLSGWNLNTGDRILVAVDHVEVGPDQDGFAGPVLIWQATSIGWSLDDEVLPDLDYPARIRSATATGEIVDLLSRHLPDTSTSMREAPHKPAGLNGIAIVSGLAAGLLAAVAFQWRRRWREGNTARTTSD